MAEAISDKRLEQLAGLAELSRNCGLPDCEIYMSGLTRDQAQDLAAEAKRARTEAEQLRAELVKAYDAYAERVRQLNAENETLRAQQKPALGNAYAAGWTDAIGAIRTPGWAEREDGWKRFLGDLCAAAAPQQPETGSER